MNGDIPSPYTYEVSPADLMKIARILKTQNILVGFIPEGESSMITLGVRGLCPHSMLSIAAMLLDRSIITIPRCEDHAAESE